MLLNKKLLFGIAVTGAIACLNVVVHADPFLPVPPASFLNYHVSTARGLSEEVAQDVVVRARLARHFGMSAPAVAAYVRQNLVETTLTAGQAGRYRVACISPSGREYFVSERLPAGTPVFALASTGQPILRLACGNPLTAVLPPVAPKPVIKQKPALLALSLKTLPVAAVPVSEISDEAFAMIPAVTSPEIKAAGPVVQVAGVTQSLSGGKGGFLFPVLFGAAGIGVLSGHHSSPPAPVPPITPTTPVVPVPPTTPTTPVVPVTPAAAVPEPSSLLLFSVFGSVLVGLQLRARWRQR